MVANRAGSRLILEDSVPPPWVGQRMTLDEFVTLPEVKPHLEFTDGLVTQKVAAKPTHGSLQAYLATRLNRVAGPLRLGRAFTETRFHTPTWSPVPDVSYYRRDRIQWRSNRPPDDFLEPPDIAVEIVSPEQRVTELIKKCTRYIGLGTQIALLIDPDDETIPVSRPGQPLQVLQGDDLIQVDELLPAFVLTVSGLFATLAPDWEYEE
jgi:Uma2 family endonuclease